MTYGLYYRKRSLRWPCCHLRGHWVPFQGNGLSSQVVGFQWKYKTVLKPSYWYNLMVRCFIFKRHLITSLIFFSIQPGYDERHLIAIITPSQISNYSNMFQRLYDTPSSTKYYNRHRKLACSSSIWCDFLHLNPANLLQCVNIVSVQYRFICKHITLLYKDRQNRPIGHKTCQYRHKIS